MKKELLLAFALVASVPLTAQLAILRDVWGNQVNGQMLVHFGDDQTPDQEVDVIVELQASAPAVINVRRYELEVVPNSRNYFCWGVCYTPVVAGTMPVWQAQSQHSVVLEPGVPATNFHAYHTPIDESGTNHYTGISTYRYVWFNVNSPTDSVWVDIQFQVTAVGLSESPELTELNVFPNPANGNDVTVAYQWAGNWDGGNLVVRNALGQQVRSRSINTATGQLAVSLAGLPGGVYFATLERRDRIVATRRIVLVR